MTNRFEEHLSEQIANIDDVEEVGQVKYDVELTPWR